MGVELCLIVLSTEIERLLSDGAQVVHKLGIQHTHLQIYLKGNTNFFLFAYPVIGSETILMRPANLISMYIYTILTSTMRHFYTFYPI